MCNEDRSSSEPVHRWGKAFLIPNYYQDGNQRRTQEELSVIESRVLEILRTVLDEPEMTCSLKEALVPDGDERGRNAYFSLVWYTVKGEEYNNSEPVVNAILSFQEMLSAPNNPPVVN
jgi:hypothetical protein